MGLLIPTCTLLTYPKDSSLSIGGGADKFRIMPFMLW